MSPRVRRMALGLATLMLLTSLLLVVQGFLNAPEVLAACSESTWCNPPWTVDYPLCCCGGAGHEHRWALLFQTCYWREVDCTINSEMFYLGAGCFGSYCPCQSW